jgi:DNA-binding NtrC family response regulator
MLNLKYPLNLVLIDDDSDMLDLMEFYIRNDKEFNVIKFTSPKEAIEFMKYNDTSIAIVDINMEEMSGDKVLRKINEIGLGTQVIIATASNNLLTFTACFTEKASGFMFKPFTQEEFLKTIDTTHRSIKTWHEVFLKMMKRKHKENA